MIELLSQPDLADPSGVSPFGLGDDVVDDVVGLRMGK
jgi:hypothetical protein